MDPISDAKKLAIQLKANEESYVTGQLDLNITLDLTEHLWRLNTSRNGGNITANEIRPDSRLMKIQAGFAKRSAKLYKPDSMVFNPTEFAVKVKEHYEQSAVSQKGVQNSRKGMENLWLQLGNRAKTSMNSTPSFNFINGTFDPDPVEIVKKKRKAKEKDKLGDLTKPESMSLAQSSDVRDMTVDRAERVLGILTELLKKNEGTVCFYEFVTDPSSFGRTIENIFILSFLVSQNCVRVVEDGNGLPCLLSVADEEKKKRNPAATKQCILSMDKEKWKSIVKTFRFKNALIPPSKQLNSQRKRIK